MPRKPCYWTRKLELDLVEFIRQRDFIWRCSGNTNHQIHQKYRAYAEFAAKLGRGFTARSVRDRWVNIRSTFNHNLRRVDKSKEVARTPADIYVPCWPLWRPLQFLRDSQKKDTTGCNFEDYTEPTDLIKPDITDVLAVKTEKQEDDHELLKIRQRAQRTDRPRRRGSTSLTRQNATCTRIVDDLVKAMKPLTYKVTDQSNPYWFFGRYVTESLNNMTEADASCARRDIMKLLDEWQTCAPETDDFFLFT